MKRKGFAAFLRVIIIYCVVVYEASYTFLFYRLRRISQKTYGLRFYGHQWVLETGLLWRQKLLNEIPQQGARWVTRAFNQVPTDSR